MLSYGGRPSPAAAVKLETTAILILNSSSQLLPNKNYDIQSLCALMGITVSTFFRVVVHDEISLIFEAGVY
jgi:hypothetical protein